jgi:hypothetical protein
MHTYTAADSVTATLSDVLVLGEGDATTNPQGLAGIGTAGNAILLPGQRMLLQINAPLPQRVTNSTIKRRYEALPEAQKLAKRREAGGGPSRAAGQARDWLEAQQSLTCFGWRAKVLAAKRAMNTSVGEDADMDADGDGSAVH